MARKFSEIHSRLSPEAQARVAARSEALAVEVQLRDMRVDEDVGHPDLAGLERSTALRMDRREDVYVSTLREFIRALGGELRLVAAFPEGDIQLRSFADHDTR